MLSRRRPFPVTAWLMTTVAFGCLAPPSRTLGQDQATPPQSDRQDDTVATLIRNLGDASYEVRTRATRKLCMFGTESYTALVHAAASAEGEIALRAKELVDTLDQLFFASVTVSLEFTASVIDWDEPVDLKITFHNTSSRPARIPFDLDDNARSSASSDVRQVSNMLDIAEYLHVQHEKAGKVDLKVDNILDDAGVAKAVRSRVAGGPISLLEPFERVVVQVRAFNRGWARYPLLDAGTYHVTFDYTPPWEDDVLRRRLAGHVASESISIAVKHGAPNTISRSGLEAAWSAKRDGNRLVVSVTNRTDQVLSINTHFGRFAPFANGYWVFKLGQSQFDWEINSSFRSASAFSLKKILAVAPGQAIEVTTISIDRLKQAFTGLGAHWQTNDATVHFVYSNVTNRMYQQQKQLRQEEGDIAAWLKTPVPRAVLTGVHASPKLSVSSLP